MQTTQQLADLQTAIKKTLHSAAFERFVVQAVKSILVDAEPASGAVLLPAKPCSHLRFVESETFRYYEVVSADGSREIAMQCERDPKDKRYFGQWYGTETRFDNNGARWTRSIGRMVQDDFGMLVRVPA